MVNPHFWITLEAAAKAARWPTAELAAAVDFALLDRRPAPRGWVVPLADAALLLLARRTCELIGRPPSIRALSLWRSALDHSGREAPLLVVRRGGVVVRETCIGGDDGRPVLAVSVPALMAQTQAAAEHLGGITDRGGSAAAPPRRGAPSRRARRGDSPA